jgi:hypothetical protein
MRFHAKEPGVMAQSTAQIFEDAAIQEFSDDRLLNNLTFLLSHWYAESGADLMG